MPARAQGPALVPPAPDHDIWPEPDLSVLRLRRRPPPHLPLTVFGPAWETWIVNAAAAASCPPDYVAAPLLASISALIGHSRWAQAADSDDVARSFRDHVARCSDMMSPA